MFAYWDHEVTSTLLVSRLGSMPENYIHFGSKGSINCLFFFLAYILFLLPQLFPRDKVLGSLATTHMGGWGVSLATTAGFTHHTHTHIHPSPPPAERTGLAEYSKSFQFFRQVCEPPPIMQRHRTQGSQNFDRR